MPQLARHRHPVVDLSEDPAAERAELRQELRPGETYRRPSRDADGPRSAQQAPLHSEATMALTQRIESLPIATSYTAPGRVRFGRTPDHLLQTIWGVSGMTVKTAATPSAPEPVFEPEPLPSEARASVETVDATYVEMPEEGVQAPAQSGLAHLSDHAFWEFAEAFETEGDDDTADEPVMATVESARPEPETEVAEPVTAPAESAADAPVASLPATAATWAGSPWGSYRINLAMSVASWAPAAEASTSAAQVIEEPEVLLPEPQPVVVARSEPVPRRLSGEFELPPIEFLAEPEQDDDAAVPIEVIQQNSAFLEGVLEDFNVRGEIVQACPGPVVTLYELEPAPGTKSSRVISLADDIARSMSAVSARVAVVQGKNAIGIELPNAKRETVYLRELLASQDFEATRHKLALCLGKTIGGEPVIADLARMPHLLVAGTTGSGKSVAINTMILSILYRLTPEQCRLIMVDPKMLELSVYDGIPHLLTPVVTDPKKAVVALKWAVREMEERYKKMSKLSVRNIDGFNARVAEAAAAGEVITRTVQTGFDKHSGEAIYEEEVMELEPLPYIVVIVDEMADLMMVAGKEIEGTIQRLAQMARAAGIHVVLATQRPSVDVITGTIKANFPTRISFQVTSKIDSRTILGEMGAEQLLGQGDMLYMAGGGRITRVHGPFVSDAEVEKVVAHLKTQGRPTYLDAVTSEEDEAAGDGDDAAVFDKTGMGQGSADSDDPYEQAVAVVLRDKKASTSYIQRRLQIGYNRAASIMERMEQEGIVGPANHAGKREILVESLPSRDAED